MSENNEAKEALRRKHLKEIEQDLDEIRKKQTQFQVSTNGTSSKLEEIRFKIELIKYLTAELEVTKAELSFLENQPKIHVKFKSGGYGFLLKFNLCRTLWNFLLT